MTEKQFIPEVKLDQNTPIHDIKPLTNPVTRSLIDRYVLLSEFCKDKTVLSISCGYGYGEMILKALGAKEVIGIDIDEKAINHINTTFAPQVKGIQGNFVKDTIDLQKKFDVIISVETFEHIETTELQHLFETIKRHSGPQTLILMTTPHRKTKDWNYNGGTHKYEYTFQEFENILNTDFDGWDVKFLSLVEVATEDDYITYKINPNTLNFQINGLIMVGILTPK